MATAVPRTPKTSAPASPTTKPRQQAPAKAQPIKGSPVKALPKTAKAAKFAQITQGMADPADAVQTPATPQAQQAKAQGQGIPLSMAGRRRQQQRSRAALDDYVRANGSMSVARRSVIVGQPLEKLGYSPSQAKDIMLDAPLDARMHDSQALTAALQYAGTITPDALAANPLGATALTAHGAVPMPAKAKLALQAANNASNPMKAKFTGLHTGWRGLLDNVQERMQPVTDRIANLPSPTGIGGLFALNMLFLFVIVPANSQGYSRMQLLYLTLLNRTKLPEEVPPQPVPSSPLFQAASGAIVAVEDAANAVNSVASALGGDVSGVGNALQGIGGAFSSLGGFVHGVTGIGNNTPAPPPGATPGTPDAFIAGPRTITPNVVPRFPGRTTGTAL